ncbi:MAG: hypothetical protein K6C36_01120 [Clostridia bacterium]|nr:hypothetical protein [Clostridia bacterium]
MNSTFNFQALVDFIKAIIAVIAKLLGLTKDGSKAVADIEASIADIAAE